MCNKMVCKTPKYKHYWRILPDMKCHLILENLKEKNQYFELTHKSDVDIEERHIRGEWGQIRETYQKERGGGRDAS